MSETPHLTEQQQKWFASVRAGLERNTGRSLADWVGIAKTCPHEKPRERQRWLKEVHGVGQNYAALIFSEAFPDPTGTRWAEPDQLVDQLWTDPALKAIYDAVAARAESLEGTISTPRKTFSAFARKHQYAALRPVKGGVRLGLALEADISQRLGRTKKEAWSERLHSVLVLMTLKDVDAEIGRLLKAAWERS
jgi:hypothetical protein